MIMGEIPPEAFEESGTEEEASREARPETMEREGERRPVEEREEQPVPPRPELEPPAVRLPPPPVPSPDVDPND